MIIIILALILAVAGVAQTISGQIQDPAGAAIPGAKVRVINQQTGVVHDTASNETGAFLAGSLTPGAYRVEVESAGFQKLSRGSLTVEVGQTLNLELKLQLGPVGESVDVNEAAPMVDSSTAAVGQVVHRDMLSGLPLPNRAASSLASLAPGVVMIDSGVGTAEN